MNDILLIVGHGARDKEGDGNREVEEFAALWRQKRPELTIQVCYIEYADVLLAEGLRRAAQQADRVLVLPLILGAAGHVRMEIPAAIEVARREFPQVTFLCSRNIGSENKVLEMVRFRLHQAMSRMDMPDPHTTGVILLGRGSSEPAANAEVAKLARWLFETTDHQLVDIAFTGITYPRLEEVVQRQIKLGMSQLVILPFYLFTGRLIKRIMRQVERLQTTWPDRPLTLAPYIGHHEKLFELMEERWHQCSTGTDTLLPCDGCSYRTFAQQHDDHHHDH
ncbi:MAG: sirohydrochlorin chelatase [Magnetococcales bacterium]|nr:sirohydrochlorin chelatase [Magnetococcales bacterium]NGZ28803.1 sirohydrochlorin chelatase [Magnetococcales bacterium]